MNRLLPAGALGAARDIQAAGVGRRAVPCQSSAAMYHVEGQVGRGMPGPDGTPVRDDQTEHDHGDYEDEYEDYQELGHDDTA